MVSAQTIDRHEIDLDSLEDSRLTLPGPSDFATPSHITAYPRLSLWEICTPDLLRSNKAHSRSLRSTAYLDGLRGIAALIVYIAHSEAWCHDADEIQEGFGYGGKYSLITLPFLRVFFTGGHAAVAVFFVISGYVLSHKPLSLIHRRSEGVYAAISSAVFRRGIRLYFPFVTITVAYFITWHIFRLDLEWPKPQANLFREILKWWSEFRDFANPFKMPTDVWFTYDFPLWTIPVEYQGSLLVFVTLLAFSRVTLRARMSLVASLAVYFLHIGLWQMFCFLCGMLLAEVDLLSATKGLRLPASNSLRFLERQKQACFASMFICAMYLAGQPSLKKQTVALGTPGWHLLTSLVPNPYATEQWWRFWLAISAPLVVLSITHLPVLRRCLETPFCQYLGKVSFALYLVHIPIAATLGDKVFRIMGFVRPLTPATGWDNWFVVPKVGPLGLELSFLLPQLVIAPLTFYLSEIVTRLVDEPSISLGKWAYERVVEW